MISTRDLSELPGIDALRRLMQSLAMLDAMLSPEWQYRYFSFNSRWSPGEQMGSMRNGQGDHYFALFNAAGCWIKGFDHESQQAHFADGARANAAGRFDRVPAEFASCLAEEAFAVGETTFWIWRRYGEQAWQRGNATFGGDGVDADGSASLLRCLDGRPQTYSEWASDYYERDVPLAPVAAIFEHRPLERQIVEAMNDALSLADLNADELEIGYPAR